MTILVLGIILFCLVHLLPAMLPSVRGALQEKLGENPYKGLFSLLIIGSLVIIVVGWKAATPAVIYAPPLPPNLLSALLIFLGLVLFFASQTNGNIKRFIRHPQMTGTILWGVAHLLVNGDSRSVALFGGLTLWAVLEILLINKRDGAWQKPGPAPLKYDIIPLVIGAVAFGAVMHFHATLFGVSAIAR